MRVRGFWSLLARNRFQIHFLGLGVSYAIAHLSVFNSLMYRIQLLWFGKRIREVELTQPPIFIVGHWRSGTTFMHELLVRDKNFASPSTYQCFAANHFLVTEWIVPKLFSGLLPRRRPMDNMAAGFERPQEDEFALCAMNAPTPYLRMAFPNRTPPFQEFLNMKDVEPESLDRFKHALISFFKALTVRFEKRLILKSPPHTGRVELLSQLFPGSKFVHLSRNPFEIYASTIRLWKTLDRNQGFQLPNYSDEELSEYVLECFERMYEGYRDQIETLTSDDYMEIKYESLVAKPLETVEAIYDKLQIEGFDTAKEELIPFLESQKDYRRSQYDIDDPTKEMIRSRWAWYFERYGYDASGEPLSN